MTQEKRAQGVQPDGELEIGDERGQQIERPIGIRGRAGQNKQPGQQPAQPGQRRHAEGESRRQFLAAQAQQTRHRSDGITAERSNEQWDGGKDHGGGGLVCVSHLGDGKSHARRQRHLAKSHSGGHILQRTLPRIILQCFNQFRSKREIPFHIAIQSNAKTLPPPDKNQ